MYQRAGISGGGGGASAPELIWANPNQYSDFAAQTINSSTSGWVSGKSIDDYDGFIIATLDYANSGATRKVGMSYIAKDVSGMTDVSARYNPVLTYSISGNVTPRTVSISSSGIAIGASAGNTYIVPWYIWGVKGALTNS